MLSVSGCRGIVGESLTHDVVRRFVGAAVSWLKEECGAARPTVVLGCDGRRGGDELRGIAGGALAACGCRVVDVGVAMTPTMGVMVVHRGADAGLTVTASHNPGQWNGLKVISREGSAPDAAAAERIIERFKRGESAAAGADGSVEYDASGAGLHAGRVVAALGRVADVERIRRRRFRVVVDSVNASGSAGARMLLESLGCVLTHVNADASGVFPHAPEPTRENLAEFTRIVAGVGADVGFAQDPDADRLAILDESGAYIGEEYTLALSALALLGAAGVKAGATLVANLSTSRMVDDIAGRFGAKVRRSAVGEANVVSVMKQCDSPMGGEGNGGVIWPAVTLIRDSLSAMALTLVLMEREARPVSAIVAGIPAYAIEKRKVELRPGLTERALAAAEGVFAGPEVRIDRQDGVRLDFPAPGGKGAAWLHVRASNTEPILRLIAEAPTRAEAIEILDRAGAVVG